tara:strand:- start:450 stop:2171 length:1722 start_codon:yes stop_codon:yes gene_type:complete
MGVPSLFKTIIKKCPDTHYWNESVRTDELYFDFNCLIHYCKAKLNFTKLGDASLREIDEELIVETIRYTSHIIKLIQPKKLVYIAIDGPVPFAKMVCQRERRYKKIQDGAFYTKMYNKYGVTQPKSFDGNKITPGTQFMTKLCSRIRNIIGVGAFSQHAESHPFRVVFSDCNASGEGEAKIMNYIKNSKRDASKSRNITIYGLDGDLIVLGMSLGIPGVKLLREPDQATEDVAKEHGSEFVYFDCDRCKDGLIKEFHLQDYDADRVVKDFTMFSFFGGNDFVDAFPHTKIRDRGLFKLFHAYTRIVPYGYLVKEDDTFDYSQLYNFIRDIANGEDSCMKRSFDSITHADPTEQETPTLESEIQAYEHSFYTNPRNPFHEYYKQHFEKVQYDKHHNVWKRMYNQHFFGKTEIKDICHEYFVGLHWTFSYYQNSVPPSWSWYYPHRNAPCSSDFLNYVQSVSIPVNITFPKTFPMTPIEQLLAVLPPQNANMLPQTLQHLMTDEDSPVIHWYPKKIKLDVLKGMKNIYSDPILPEIDQEQLSIIARTFPVHEQDAKRNTLKESAFQKRFNQRYEV